MDADHPLPLVLSTADWDRPIWTNKQHLARELARRLPNVWFVNSMGLRRPGVTAADAARVVERVRKLTTHRRTTAGPVPPTGMRVITPFVVPVHRLTWPTARVNRRLLARAVEEWLSLPRSQRVLWTFSPVTYGLERQAEVTIYHCVDLLREIPGYDPVAVTQGEHALAEAGVVAIATSSVVKQHLEAVGFRDVLLWENVADANLISARAASQSSQPGHVAFIGNLTELKLNVSLLIHTLSLEPRLTLHLAGPVAEGGGRAGALGELLRHRQVRVHGTLQPDGMAELLGRCRVGVIPYLRNPYTAGVFPMKVYEYLAAGLPVVSTDLPSLRGAVTERLAAHVDVAADAEAFSLALIMRAMADVDPSSARERQNLAAANSWERRGDDAVTLLRTLLERS